MVLDIVVRKAVVLDKVVAVGIVEDSPVVVVGSPVVVDKAVVVGNEVAVVDNLVADNVAADHSLVAVVVDTLVVVGSPVVVVVDSHKV